MPGKEQSAFSDSGRDWYYVVVLMIAKLLTLVRVENSEDPLEASHVEGAKVLLDGLWG